MDLGNKQTIIGTYDVKFPKKINRNIIFRKIKEIIWAKGAAVVHTFNPKKITDQCS